MKTAFGSCDHNPCPHTLKGVSRTQLHLTETSPLLCRKFCNLIGRWPWIDWSIDQTLVLTGLTSVVWPVFELSFWNPLGSRKSIFLDSYQSVGEGVSFMMVPFWPLGVIGEERKQLSFSSPLKLNFLLNLGTLKFNFGRLGSTVKRPQHTFLPRLPQELKVLEVSIAKAWKNSLFLAHFPLKFDLKNSCSAEEQSQCECKSNWMSLALVRCSSMSSVIRPNNITKSLYQDFSLDIKTTVFIMTLDCRNATRQPKASPLSAKERVVVSLSEWYWMPIAFEQVLTR